MLVGEKLFRVFDFSLLPEIDIIQRKTRNGGRPAHLEHLKLYVILQECLNFSNVEICDLSLKRWNIRQCGDSCVCGLYIHVN